MAYGALASPWGGFKNGQIPDAFLSVIPTTYNGRTVITFGPLGPQKLRTEGIAGLLAMADTFLTKFGHPLIVYEGYRDLARQQELYNGWEKRLPGYNLAAAPSTSPHGWGGSVDIEGGIDVYGSPQKVWADSSCASFGYAATGNTFSPREAWHYDIQSAYIAPDVPTASQEEEMAPKLNRIRNYDGKIGIVDGAGCLHPFADEGTYNAYVTAGLIDAVNVSTETQPDGTVWNACVAFTIQQKGATDAQQIAALIVPAVISGLQGSGTSLTQAQVEAAAEAAIKDVFAAAAK